MRLYLTDMGHWVGTQAEAGKLVRAGDGGSWVLVEVPTDKEGLLAFLNARLQIKAAAPVAPSAGNYSAQSIAFEDAFAALPLALKLHFAALAIEEARQAIRPAKGGC